MDGEEMNRRIGLIALVAVCAVAFSAVAASAAGAAIGPYTAYTCVKGGSGPKFSDPDCTSTSEAGEYSHKSITAGQETQLTVKQLGAVTKLKTKIGLATVTLEATGVECVECMFKNVTGGTVEAKGGHLRYTGVTINVPSCKVVGEAVNTEPLETKATSMASEAGMTFNAEVAPVTPGTEAVIHLENNGAETCALGTSITVTGHANGLAEGSMATFATGAGELLVGTQKAELIGEITISGGETGKTEHNPLALTTGA
jgi:hypothetical protein